MKLETLFMVSILFFYGTWSFGCTCEWNGNFIKAHKFSELTVLGKVIKVNTIAKIKMIE